MDFAPYQDTPPDTVRAASPTPPTSPRQVSATSTTATKTTPHRKTISPPSRPHLSPNRPSSPLKPNSPNPSWSSQPSRPLTNQPQPKSSRRVIGDGVFYGTSAADIEASSSNTQNYTDGDVDAGGYTDIDATLPMPASSLAGACGRDVEDGLSRADMNLFETGLGMRLDWEACAAYVLLPPAGAVGLLMLEHRSDYVR